MHGFASPQTSFFRAAFTTSSLDRVVTAIDSARIQRGTRKISYSVDRIRDRSQCPGLSQ